MIEFINIYHIFEEDSFYATELCIHKKLYSNCQEISCILLKLVEKSYIRAIN